MEKISHEVIDSAFKGFYSKIDKATCAVSAVIDKSKTHHYVLMIPLAVVIAILFAELLTKLIN